MYIQGCAQFKLRACLVGLSFVVNKFDTLSGLVAESTRLHQLLDALQVINILCVVIFHILKTLFANELVNNRSQTLAEAPRAKR
eukprot:SAG31_NODE_40_length_31360_cov_6.751575_16_plen_84_part_00